MKTVATLGLCSLLAVCFVPALTACHHGEVSVGLYGNDGYYDYDYYPNDEVYYYPAGSVWYWRDHDEWRHGRELPNTFHVEHEEHVGLHERTANPWERHAQIRAAHPGHRDEEHH